ncbi:MAG TPA: hypothetical protein VF525_07980 [Pyrinomonadaceae bacterium]|jgi:hypothetical protein
MGVIFPNLKGILIPSGIMGAECFGVLWPDCKGVLMGGCFGIIWGG